MNRYIDTRISEALAESKAHIDSSIEKLAIMVANDFAEQQRQLAEFRTETRENFERVDHVLAEHAKTLFGHERRIQNIEMSR